MNIALLLNFSRQDLIDRYAGSVLGGTWSFILPFVNIAIFALVFSKIMGARLESFGQEFSQYGYSIYLIACILPWNSFANTIIRTTTVYRDKAGLLTKVNIGLKTLPVYMLFSEAFIYLVSMVFFAGFLMLIGFPVDKYWFFIPVIYFIQQLFAYALGFTLAILSVFIRDIREFISVVIQLWFWLTPIVYVVTILPEGLFNLAKFNPFYVLVNAYREVIIAHQLPDFNGLAVLLCIGLGMLFLSLFLCNKLEKELRDFL